MEGEGIWGLANAGTVSYEQLISTQDSPIMLSTTADREVETTQGESDKITYTTDFSELAYKDFVIFIFQEIHWASFTIILLLGS